MTAEPIRVSIRIDAPPERVWKFFTRPEAMIRWMGECAVLAPWPGGEFTVNIKGAPIRGRYLELDPPHRLVVSWGCAGSEELPPGTSTVEICLVREGTGTRVHLEHRDLPAPEELSYARGWTHYLARLAAAGTREAGPDPGTGPACSRNVSTIATAAGSGDEVMPSRRSAGVALGAGGPSPTQAVGGTASDGHVLN